MPLTKIRLFDAKSKATLDSAIAAYKAGAGTELATKQRAAVSSLFSGQGRASRTPRFAAALAWGGMNVPVSKTADLQHLVAEGDTLAGAQAAVDTALAGALHATDATGNTTVAGKVTVTSATFFAPEDVGRLMTVDTVEKTITAISDNAVAATGSLTALAKASLADGDLFTIDDGVLPAVTFEFDVSGTNVPAPGNIDLDISTLTTAIEVANAMRTAIEANLGIDADAPGAALINLVNDVGGTAGNVAITETLAVGTLTPVGMANGVNATTTSAHYAGAALVSGTGKTVKLFGAECLQSLALNLYREPDADYRFQVMAAVEGQVA